jgi:hypothetical protein
MATSMDSHHQSEADPVPGATPAHRRRNGALDAVMSNPLVGLAPWIIYSLVEGQNRLELSSALALGTAVLVLCVNWIRGGTPKMLEWSDVVYFTGLTIVIAFASAGTRTWLELWGGEVANVALFVIVLGSILVRQPFTLQYAKEDAPPEMWDEPHFLRANYVISWVWALAFFIEAASGWYGDAVLRDSNNLWTGWIIQTLPMIVAAQFTIWYPNRLRALGQGRISEAPTLRDFLGTVTPWITVVGILSLCFDAAPEWLGIAFIVLGIFLTKGLNAHKAPAALATPIGRHASPEGAPSTVEA